MLKQRRNPSREAPQWTVNVEGSFYEREDPTQAAINLQYDEFFRRGSVHTVSPSPRAPAFRVDPGHEPVQPSSTGLQHAGAQRVALGPAWSFDMSLRRVIFSTRTARTPQTRGRTPTTPRNTPTYPPSCETRPGTDCHVLAALCSARRALPQLFLFVFSCLLLSMLQIQRECVTVVYWYSFSTPRA